MDHAGMHHAGMDHGGMDMDDGQCSMNMLFTWSTHNLCIIFPSWRVTSPASLVLSLLLVGALTAGYEALRAWARRFDARIGLPGGTPDADEQRSLLPGGAAGTRGGERRVARAAVYAAQVFYSFFIMLLFMTYNGWVMLAVAGGAFVGHLAFAPADEGAAKTVACH